jgi:acetyl esterase/lipase
MLQTAFPKRLATALAAALVAACAAPAAMAQPLQTTPLPVESLARHPALSQVVISPDGRHIAGLIAIEGQRWPAIAIWTVDNLSAPPVAIPSTQMRPRSVSFLGNDRIVFFADQPFTYDPGSGTRKDFTVEAVVTDLRGSRFEQPLGGGLGVSAQDVGRVAGVNFRIIQAGSLQDPDAYIVARIRTDTFDTEIVSLDARSLRTRRFARVGDDQNYLLADIRDGQLMVRERLRIEGGAYQVVREVRNRQSGAWEEHPDLGYPIRERLTLTPLGFYDPDPNKLFVATNRGTDLASIRVYNIATRQWDAEPAFASPEYDLMGMSARLDWANKQVLGPASYTVGGPAASEVFIDDYWAPIQRTLQSQFAGQNVSIDYARLRTGYAIVTVDGPQRPPAYYLLINGRELNLLGRSRPWIDPGTLGQTTFIRYKARDGLTIPAFLTLPPGYVAARHGRIPLVVLPHGGPWARDYLGWDGSGWPQFLATRGYAIVQPQYRGSDGWGMAHWRAGDQQWGLKMSDDNDDAAAHLVAEGVADPNRMAIFGYSYGGFAAIAASVRPNSPYRCALSGAGVSDLQRLGNLWGANRIGRELQGWTVTGMDPIENVRNANIPILLYHGDRDRQADTIHSRDFHRAMRGAGKSVEYHEIADMWHQLPWWPEWHRQSLGYIESWLAGPNCFGGAPRTN